MALSVLGSLGDVLLIPLWFLGYFFYFALSEWLWNGLTVGKLVMGLRVLMSDGTPVTFSAALYRNLMRAADFVPTFYLVGIMSIMFSPKRQRLGDLVADTIVVTTRYQLPLQRAPHNFAVHPLEKHLPSLRRMTRPEYNLLKQIADRAPRVPPQVLEEKIGLMWPAFAEKHHIAPIPGVHTVYLIEAVVMKYSRERNLL